MAQFRYRALNEEGDPVEGTMEAASAYRATQKLQERGLTVNTVDAVHVAGPGLLRSSTRLSWEELNLFAQELEAVTRSGLPLGPALKALAAESPRPRLRAVLNDLHHRLERGESLEEAMAGVEGRVPRLLTSLVRAGEQGGNLPGILQLLSGYTDRMVRLKYSLRITLAYPVITLVMAAVITGGLLYFVVPTFAEIFREFGADLPAPTKLLVGLSALFRDSAGGLLSGVAVFVVLMTGVILLARRLETGRQWLDALQLRLPGSGRVYYLVAVTRFCRTLAVLLASGTPIIEALELAGAASGSPALERAVSQAALQIADGESITDALRNTGFFGYDLCWLVGAAERRGQVEEAFDHTADKYEREIAVQESTLGAMASPLSVVAIGLVVGFIVFSLYLPIFTLGDSISGT